MVFKSALIIMVILILMEDGSSIQKTVEEEREDEEVAKAVNRTLAEEEKRKEEEDEAKRKKGKEIKQKGKKESGEDEASPTFNCSCPLVKPCQKCPEEPDCPSCEDCPQPKECPAQEICPEIVPCHPCEECGPCPEIRPCKPCRPCGPCPVVNYTETTPSICHCSEEAMGMTVPVALLVGVCAGGLLTGAAAVLGLVIQYFSPLECGFVFLATIIIVWYFSSQYPETARELGGRAATLLREAATALSHRVMEALRHHHEQVGLPSNLSFPFKKLSSMFYLQICTKIFYVEKIKF
jgi:hypothetical protein